MLTRPPSGNNTRPQIPQRSVSTGPQHLNSVQPNTHRPNLPSRLSAVRSASGPSQYVDLTENGAMASRRKVEAWKQDQIQGVRESSQDVVDLSDEAEEGRPRKRAKIEADTVMVESPQAYNEDSHGKDTQLDSAYTVVPGQPMDVPPRPPTASKPGRRRPGPNDPARKADGLNPPAMATRLPPPKTVADFNPWNGSHPEDVLNEQVIKGGYFDKTSGPNHNESNSARHSIWPNLSQKNNIALQTLSHLFTQVLDKRQSLGRCTAPSSFKPPPRVTVTDTKREAWLKDLANTSIPLRRQSRTIPHGIRGKLLMDQCLAKAIPLQRAVWLAKCVGANELRAFRRKGVSGSAAAQGEAKWIRDWTVSVEQFLDAIANACGQEEWRRKIDYAIKLVSAFYSEGLLDKDEFLGWIVRSFAAASTDKLPLWTIIVQIYWRDLISFGRRGRKLAVAILEHLRLLTEKHHPALEPLKARLHKLIAVLAVTDRGCLILPRTWQKYKVLLELKQSAKSDIGTRQALLAVAQRNERLAVAMHHSTHNTRSPLVELYATLDCVGLDIDTDKLSTKCQELVPAASELTAALLRWASTLFRRGQARVYIAAKIIARMHIDGHDTDQAILDHMQHTADVTASEASQVWTVVAQLVEDECFSAGKYLQWLIASGSMFATQQTSLACGLLAALPAEKLPLHLRNLRLTLLRRLGAVTQDDATIAWARNTITTAIGDSNFDPSSLDATMKHLTDLQRLELGQWVRAMAPTWIAEGLSIAAFCILRQCFEQLNDMEALSNLVGSAVGVDDLVLLATACDTLNMHALSFASLGRLVPMVDRMVERHRQLRAQIPLDRAFLQSLLALVKLLPDKAAAQKLLISDLAAYEQQHAAAVCSPASDSLISMQAGSLDSDAEIDAVFASGNSMDEQTMQRVFLRVIQRASKADTNGVDRQSRVGGWLNQLRIVDGPGFEKLAKEYVTAVLQKAQGNADGTQGIVALIGGGCIGLTAADTVASTTTSSITAATMLYLVASPISMTALSALEGYSYRLQQQRWCAGHSTEVAHLVRTAAEEPSFAVDADWVLDLVLRTITRHPDKLCKSFADNQASATVRRASARICRALLLQGRPASPNESELDPCDIVRSAIALNKPVAVGWLRIYLQGQTTATSAESEAIKEALLQAVKDRSQVWPQLLSAARPEMLKSIHEWARSRLLMAAGTSAGDTFQDEEETLQECLEVLGVTYSSVRDDDDAQTIAVLAEKLRAQDRLVDSLNFGADSRPRLHAAARSLSVLLQLSALYAQGDTTSDTSRQARVQLVTALCSLLAHPRLQPEQGLMDHIHDVAAAYIDVLPSEALPALARALPPAQQMDKRISSLVGKSGPSDAWLALASRVQPPAAAPQTAQQRALARQPSQSQAASSRIPTQGQGPSKVSAGRAAQQPVEMKYTPYPLRRWEIMADPTPVMGENDCSISLGLVGARKV